MASSTRTASVRQSIDTTEKESRPDGNGVTVRPEEDEFPDGGLRAWLVVAGVCRAFQRLSCSYTLADNVQHILDVGDCV